LFYLLNVALSLDLYGDFSQPLRPGLALSPWDFLALAGRHWFGSELTADPVWLLLARLAGRSTATPPGKGFKPPTDWHLPSGWLAPWEPLEQIGLHATRARVLLWHPAGFALAQAPRRKGDKPRDIGRALIGKIPSLEHARLARAAVAIAMPRGALARWITLLLGAVCARLAAALDVPASETPAMVCRHAGLIHHGLARLDVTLSLADLPIAIRLAGLDRDPGWIPASGRAIAFRFA